MEEKNEQSKSKNISKKHDKKKTNTNKKTNKKKHKKHYYHKGKFSYSFDYPLNNPGDVYLAIKGDTASQKETDWIQYFNWRICDGDDPVLSPEQDLATILGCIKSDQLQKRIIRTLYNLDDYNIFKDDIPMNSMPKDIRNVISKKQNYIKQFYNYSEIYYNTLVLFDRGQTLDEINALLELKDNVIFVSDENIRIYSYQLNIASKLDEKEPRNWIYKDFSFRNKKKTHLDFMDQKTVNYFDCEIIGNMEVV